MTLYLAKKGNIQFYIQPYQLEDYSNLGYEIYKLEPELVADVEEESKNAESGVTEGFSEG